MESSRRRQGAVRTWRLSLGAFGSEPAGGARCAWDQGLRNLPFPASVLAKHVQVDALDADGDVERVGAAIRRGRDERFVECIVVEFVAVECCGADQTSEDGSVRSYPLQLPAFRLRSAISLTLRLPAPVTASA